MTIPPHVSTVVDQRGVVQIASASPTFDVLIGLARTSVGTVAELSTLNDSLMETGSVAYVSGRDAIFVLEKNSSATAVTGLIVAGRSTNSRWHRAPVGSVSAARRTAWTIDPVNGSDDAVGSSSAPLKTHTELERRWWGEAPLSGYVTVTIASDLPASDPLKFTLSTAKMDGYAVQYVGGVKTTHASGTLTAVQAISRGSNLVTEIQASGLSSSWTALGCRGKKIKIVGGARDGAVAWIAKDLGTANKVARCSPFISRPSNFSSSATVVTPQIGDNFVVVSDIELLAQPMIECGSSNKSSTHNDVFFFDLRLTGPAWWYGQGHFRGAVSYVHCDAHAGFNIEGTVSFRACGSRIGAGIYMYELATMTLAGTLVDGVVFGFVSIGSDLAIVILSNDTLLDQGATIDNYGTIYVSNVAVMDCGYDAFIARANCRISISAAIYGSGNTNNIIYMGSLARGVYTNKALLTAVTSLAAIDFANGVTKGFSELPFVSNATADDTHAALILNR